MIKRFSKIRTKAGIETVDTMSYLDNTNKPAELEVAHLPSFSRVMGAEICTFEGNAYSADEVKCHI